MSKDITIHSLYNDILKELPFTISGNASLEQTIYQFLQKVAETPFLADNKNIRFVMGGFARIKLHDLQHLFQNKWETERLRSFFYYDYEDDNVELLLSIYQYCLSEVTNKNEFGQATTKNITNIICDNNYGGVNFRVKVVEKISKIRITYIRRDHVLEALIPKRFFKSEFNLIEFAAEGENHETIVERSNHNLYEYWRTGNNQDYKSLVSSLFDQEFVPEKFKKDVKEFILNIKIENSVKKSILRNQEANFEEIYCLFYVAGLLSYLLDCNIEYFTSVANTVGGCKYSLGSIAVGYKTEILSNDTRAFFSIISNHIASNLASQILLESNNMKYYLTMREGQEQFISNFSLHYELGTNSLHCGKKNEEGYSLKNKNLTTDFVFPLNWTNYTKEEIEKSFGEGFIEYLKTVLDHEEIDWGMYEGYHGLADCCNKVNSFYKKYIISDCSGLDLVLLDNQINPKKEEVKIIKPKVNVYLPHLLINKIENDKKRKVEVINTKTEKAKAIIEVKYEQPINIMHLVEALVKDTKAGGSFPDFIRNNYDAFRICGDLVVKGPKDLFEISLKNDFKVVSVKEGSPTKLLFIGNPNPIKETNELTFEIHYNLF